MLTFRYPVSLKAASKRRPQVRHKAAFVNAAPGSKSIASDLPTPAEFAARPQRPWRTSARPAGYRLPVNCDQNIQRAQARSVAWSASVNILRNPARSDLRFCTAKACPD